MSRSLKRYFCRLLTSASARQPPSLLPTCTIFGFRGLLKSPSSQSFNGELYKTAKSSTVIRGHTRRAVTTRAVCLQHGRFLHVDARGYEHFQRKGFGGAHGRDRSKLYYLILISIGGVFMAVYATHQEVVPYTLRKHFVIVSPKMEQKLVDRQFTAMKKQFKSAILPPGHPQAVRVRNISSDVIQSVMEGTKLEKNAQLLEEGDKEMVDWSDHTDTTFAEQWDTQSEVIEDQWANQSRKKGLKEGAKPFVEHLKAIKWEVLVVNQDVANAFALPGGKIVIFTGLLKQFPGDAEIATVIGHEVAHVVARHSAEKLTRHFLVLLFELVVLTFFYAPDLVRGTSNLLLELPFSRSQELEADHIGLLLMAGAGYDPRVAPAFYEKLDKESSGSAVMQYVNTHPSGSKRGERLRKTGTMEQAVNIYMEKSQGKTVEGFL